MHKRNIHSQQLETIYAYLSVY